MNPGGIGGRMQKVDGDTAAADFERLALAWDLDNDTAAMEEEDRNSYEMQRRRLVRSIMLGTVTVDEAGDVVTVDVSRSEMESTKELTFRIPTGAATLSFDKYKDRQSVHKLNAYMAGMTGQSPGLFARLDARDGKVCQALAVLFLAS